MVVLSHVAFNSYSYSSGSEIRCYWNCSVHTADLTALTREMKTSMATNEFIKLGVREDSGRQMRERDVCSLKRIRF